MPAIPAEQIVVVVVLSYAFVDISEYYCEEHRHKVIHVCMAESL